MPNGNFLCVVAVIDLWLDVMVEAFIFNLKEKYHVIMEISDDWDGDGDWAIALLLKMTHYEIIMLIPNSNPPNH